MKNQNPDSNFQNTITGNVVPVFCFTIAVKLPFKKSTPSDISDNNFRFGNFKLPISVNPYINIRYISAATVYSGYSAINALHINSIISDNAVCGGSINDFVSYYGVHRSRVGVIRNAVGVIRNAVGVIRIAVGVIRNAVGVIRNAVGVIWNVVGVHRSLSGNHGNSNSVHGKLSGISKRKIQTINNN